MTILLLESVSKSYGMKQLFQQVQLSIQDGDKIGLVGMNGTGKSTLLKIMAGQEVPDQGQVIKRKDIRLHYLPQHPDFDQPLTVLDYVFSSDSALSRLVYEYEKVLYQLEQQANNRQIQQHLNQLISKMDALDAWEWETNAKTILTKLGITQFEQQVHHLSGGQKKRVAMAKALIHAADLLILDEPTNHIDHASIEWLEEYLAKYKGSLVLITHDRYFLDRVVNHIVEIDQGNLYEYKGNYSTFLEQKAARAEQSAASEDKRQNILRRELAWLRRGAKARTTKQKARIDRIHDLQNRKSVATHQNIDFSALGEQRLGKKVLEMEQISKQWGGRQLIADFSYIVLPGDRLGIIGPNGSGKSTLLTMLAGRIKPDQGKIHQGETVRLAYYDQESKELPSNQKVIEYIKAGAEVIQKQDGSTITASQMLELFLFPPNVQWTTISNLSGGEKRRLYLLRLLMESPNVLLLDEPTNDLDIQTLTILEEYLEQFQGSVITVSHDRYFLDRTVDHLFYFAGNGKLVHFNGNYSEYLDIKKEEEAEEKRKKKESKPVPARQTNKEGKPKKMSFYEQKEFEEIEGKIAALEEKNDALLQEIEKTADQYQKLMELTEEQSRVADQLDQLVERWAELSELAQG